MQWWTLHLSFAMAVGLASADVHAQQTMSADMRGKIEAAAKDVLEKTGVPSAQVGVVQDGRIVYTAAFGKARINPDTAATTSMPYPIGSISKQFTAACVLKLVEQGKMRLEDPVARWFPEFTRAQDVTVRMLLSHTSGYSDYAPQDYTIPAWTKAVDPLKLVHDWAEKPLDFEPGTKWQYSNTNFVIAALIVEKVTGQPFWSFLKENVLDPLDLKHVVNLNTDRDRLEGQGYMRNALAPVRPAILEAPGWYYGDADLAMPVAELLQWDISLMNESVLRPESYLAMETEVVLQNGAPTQYGLAMDVRMRNGHRELAHGGEVGGYVAQNTILPDDHAAVVVLTNEEASGAAASIAQQIVTMLEAGPPGKGAPAAEVQVRAILDGLEQGKLDRSALTEDCSFYFSKETVDDFQSSLKPLGPVTEVKQTREGLRGGMTFRLFEVSFKAKKVNVTTYAMPDGKLEQFLVEAGE